MEAWATRAGYQQPARFVDWVEAMWAAKAVSANPRGAGVGLPATMGYQNLSTTLAAGIRERKPIGLYGTPDLAIVTTRYKEALAVAEPLNKPEPATETRYFLALLAMYEKLNTLSECTTGLDLSQAANASKTQKAWAAYQEAVDAALAANAKRIELWRAEPADYVEKTQEDVRSQWLTVRKAMGDAIGELLKNPQAGPRKKTSG